MDCLYINRDKSRKLPFDIMNIIYEYADTFSLVKQQIKNKDYDLDNIMYKRILNIIKIIVSTGLYFYLDAYKYVSNNDIYEEKYKQPMLNYYRQYMLYYEKYKNRICGLDTRYNFYCQRTKIIMDLEANKIKINKKSSTKQLYKKWLKL